MFPLRASSRAGHSPSSGLPHRGDLPLRGNAPRTHPMRPMKSQHQKPADQIIMITSSGKRTQSIHSMAALENERVRPCSECSYPTGRLRPWIPPKGLSPPRLKSLQLARRSRCGDGPNRLQARAPLRPASHAGWFIGAWCALCVHAIGEVCEAVSGNGSRFLGSWSNARRPQTVLRVAPFWLFANGCHRIANTSP